MPQSGRKRNSIVIKNFTKKDKHGEKTKCITGETDVESSALARMIQEFSQLDDDASVEGDQPQPLTMKRPRSVRFGTITIREHNLIAGDSPACSSGMPISIGWKCLTTKTFPITKDDPSNTADEKTDSSEDEVQRRSYMEMRVPPGVRDQWLREAGYSRQELQELGRPINIARAQRRRTVETFSLATIQETLERASKGIQKRLLAKKEQRRREEYLKQWRTPDKAWMDRSSHSAVTVDNSFHSCPSKLSTSSFPGAIKKHRRVVSFPNISSIDDSHTSISTIGLESDLSLRLSPDPTM